MSLKKVFLNIGAFVFISSQVLAGLLNYGFQIYASKFMTIIEFGEWSQWLASFSVACFFSVWLQSLSVISGFYHWIGERKFHLVFMALAFLFIVFWFLHHFYILSIIGWGASLLGGVLAGYCLRRKSLKLLAIVSLVAAISRFLWVFLDSAKDSFYVAVLFAPLVSCLIYLFGLRNEKKKEVVTTAGVGSQVMMASFSLAFFSAWVPQADLLLLSSILQGEGFGLFAKVALLSKGFFFAFQILAQMILSHQVSSGENILTSRNLLYFSTGGTLLSLMAGVVAWWVGWPVSWAVLNILHVTTLCLLFILIQGYSAQKLGQISAVICGLVVALCFFTSRLAPSIEIYWAVVVTVEALLIFYLSVFRKK